VVVDPYGEQHPGNQWKNPNRRREGGVSIRSAVGYVPPQPPPRWAVLFYISVKGFGRERRNGVG